MPSPNRLTVELLPAGVGDAVLLRCVVDGRPTNILIDGGVRSTYSNCLEQKLLELKAEGQKLDLFVVTHIDSDHIGGAIELLEKNGRADAPGVIEICDIWHNGYRHLGLQGRPPTSEEKRKVLAQISRTGDSATSPGNISVREADTLARLIKEGSYSWNSAWGGRSVVAGNTKSIAPKVDITVLSPRQSDLEALAYQWRSALLKMGVSFEAVECDEFEEAYEKEMPRLDEEMVVEDTEISATAGYEPPDPSSFVEDTSFTNGSSIAFLLEVNGVTTLFLGDSWSRVITENWTNTEAMKVRPLELVKVSHHGSKHNTSPELAKRIAAKYYLFSADGSKHGHPNVETLLWIADESEEGATLVFNYPTSASDFMNQPAVKARYGYEMIVGDGRDSIIVEIEGEDQI